MAVVVGISGCNVSGPSYSVEDATGKVIVTIKKTDVGDITVEIPKPADDSRTRVSGGVVVKQNYRATGSGKSSGTRSKDGKKVDYEVTYTSEGTSVTITSVTVNGKDVPKSAW